VLLVHIKPFAVNAEMTFSSLWYTPSVQLMRLSHHVVTNSDGGGFWELYSKDVKGTALTELVS